MNFLIPFITIISFLAYQQQTKLVANIQTRLPVKYATVKVLHKTLGKVSGDDGTFRLNVVLTDTLLISCAGYEDLKIAGNKILDTIFLKPWAKMLEPITVGSPNKGETHAKHFVGNGSRLINETVECNTATGFGKDCYRWGQGGNAQFAEPIYLPDPTKNYKLLSAYLPFTKRSNSCTETIFLHILEMDSLTQKPSKIIATKKLNLLTFPYKKRKFIIDLQKENIYFDKTKAFFISLTWEESEIEDPNCGLLLSLFKSTNGITYNRSVNNTNYDWMIFSGSNLLPGEHYHTMFAVELEEVD